MVIEATYITHSGDDNLVVNAARVSFRKQADKYTDEGNHGLIRYLAKHNHKSPFNHTWATFHVKAPIFVARQLQKHEYMPWNEVSRRYVDDEPELFVPDVWRGRSADKKQGSEGVVEGVTVSEYNEVCVDVYNQMLEAGVAPEQARMVLPQSMYTEWYWSGTCFAFAKMCNLRLSPDTQYESRLVAQQISDKMAEIFPVSWEALMTDYTFEKKIEELEAKLSESEALLAKAVKLMEVSVEVAGWELDLDLRDEVIEFFTELKGEK